MAMLNNMRGHTPGNRHRRTSDFSRATSYPCTTGSSISREDMLGRLGSTASAEGGPQALPPDAYRLTVLQLSHIEEPPQGDEAALLGCTLTDCNAMLKRCLLNVSTLVRASKKAQAKSLLALSDRAIQQANKLTDATFSQRFAPDVRDTITEMLMLLPQDGPAVGTVSTMLGRKSKSKLLLAWNWLSLAQNIVRYAILRHTNPNSNFSAKDAPTSTPPLRRANTLPIKRTHYNVGAERFGSATGSADLLGPSPVEQMVQAASEGDLGQVERLHKGLGALLVRGEGGRVAAHWAAEHGQEATLQRIVALGASESLGWTDAQGSTPAWLACLSGHVGCVRALHNFGHGESLFAANQSLGGLGITPAYACATGGHEACLRALYELETPARRVAPGAQGVELACACAREGRAGCLRVLSERGVDVGAADSDGFSVACHAATNGHANVITELPKLGVPPRALAGPCAGGVTPAIAAARGGHAGALRALAEVGARASLTAADDQGGTPMSYAERFGHAEVLEVLRELGVGREGGGLDEDGCVLCLDGPKTMVVVPCGHKVLCEQCADFSKFLHEKTRPFSACPVCRATMVKPFFMDAAIFSSMKVYDA